MSIRENVCLTSRTPYFLSMEIQGFGKNAEASQIGCTGFQEKWILKSGYLSLCILIDSSFCFDTINLVYAIVHF